jgi:hypothetical protein
MLPGSERVDPQRQIAEAKAVHVGAFEAQAKLDTDVKPPDTLALAFLTTEALHAWTAKMRFLVSKGSRNPDFSNWVTMTRIYWSGFT